MKTKLLVYFFLLFSLISLANEHTNSKEKKAIVTTETSFMPTVAIDDITLFESDGTTAIPIYIDAPDTVDTVISISTMNGTAISPNDYTTLVTTVTIPAGQTSVDIMISLVADGLSGEVIETFTINGTVTSGNTNNNSVSGTISIIDVDDSSLGIGDVTVYEGDGTAVVPLTIGLNVFETVIQITTVDNTATSSGDYTTTVMTATIPALQTMVYVSIPIFDDTTGEPIENFTVNGMVTSGNILGSSASGTVTIIDDDTVTATITDNTIQEIDGTAVVAINISNPSAVDTVISVATADGSATDPLDYTATSLNVTIPAGQVVTYMSIPISDDDVSEPTEDINIQGTVLSGNTNNISIFGTVTIIDNDDSIVNMGDVTVSEDAGNINVPITIQGLSTIPTTLNITAVDNLAINPDDYVLVSASVTIPALQSSANIVISITDDDVFEFNENFTVFATVTSGNTLNSNISGTVTIVDDGSCGAFTVGEPCDDGNPLTLSDFIDANCNCIGEAIEDVDGDGISNGQEVLNFTDYNDSCDPVQNAGYAGFNSNNVMWQAANCDNDDVNNALEIILGTDPYDTNYNRIQGTMAFDVNNDGCNGTDDLVFPYARINISDGTNTDAIYTNSMGDYEYYTTTGNFTITPDLENPTFFNVSPANASTNFSNTNNNVFNQDFCITSNGVNLDVEIIIAPIGVARPGFDAMYMLTYKNNGNHAVSGAIDFMYDETLLDFVSSPQMPSAQAAGTINWTYTDLTPFETRNIFVTLNVNAPTDIPAVNIDDELVYTAMITPISGDVLPANNQFDYTQIVVGSYDPNDITCVEGAFVDPDDIGEDLHYIINFENTGTFFAENIVVEMQIDPAEFDINTLRLLSASHEANVTIKGDMVRFIFQNIFLLPDGQGYILIKLKSLNTLVENDIVSNQASIFFDYNFPIVTNNAQTKFSAPLSNPAFKIDSSITIFPNPTKNNLHITADNTIKSIALYDVQGRMLTQEIHNEKEVNLDISNQASGVYFIQINTENGVNTEKIIKL
jgi:hypothetical protein